ncbi:MAG: DUF2188 domain-containing protein [Cupriavidus sp.]|nr:DUF2188 domain-containing protein [Cupriavidus sp.]
MSKNSIHVLPASEGWVVEVEGGRDRTVYPSQMAAIAAGWERAKREGVDLLLYGRDGEVWSRDTFDNEPPAVKQ